MYTYIHTCILAYTHTHTHIPQQGILIMISITKSNSSSSSSNHIYNICIQYTIHTIYYIQYTTICVHRPAGGRPGARFSRDGYSGSLLLLDASLPPPSPAACVCVCVCVCVFWRQHGLSLSLSLSG